jgi:hypothetical protein
MAKTNGAAPTATAGNGGETHQTASTPETRQWEREPKVRLLA